MNVSFNFFGEISNETVLSFQKFINELRAIEEDCTVDFLVASPGGFVSSGELIIFYLQELLKHCPQHKYRFFILGEASSCMFDILFSVRGKADFLFCQDAFSYVHVSEDSEPTPRDVRVAKEFERKRRADIKASYDLYKNVLTRIQLAALKKGHDVYINNNDLKKIFNGRDIY